MVRRWRRGLQEWRTEGDVSDVDEVQVDIDFEYTWVSAFNVHPVHHCETLVYRLPEALIATISAPGGQAGEHSEAEPYTHSKLHETYQSVL